MNTSWPVSTEQYAYQQNQQQQGLYAQPYATQPSFDHFNLQQQSYAPTQYTTTSPYTSQSQYQHARPSDVFGPTSYNLDPALQTSTEYPADSSFSFGLHGANNDTISPQTLQYQMASAQSPTNASFQQPANGYNRPQQASFFQNGNLQNTETSIQYPALPRSSSNPEPKQKLKTSGGADDSSSTASAPSQQKAQARATQNVLRITHPELLANGNPSTRPQFPYAPFLFWEDTPIQVAPGLKSEYQISSTDLCSYLAPAAC
jgi:hypothetical protein